jgi:hypothetical protein
MEGTPARSHFPTFVYYWSLLPWWLRPRPRLSLRSLMVLVLILGGGFGWVVHRADVQRDAVAAIERAGGIVRYEFFRLSSKNYRLETPKWLSSLLGVDYVATVKGVYLPPPTRRRQRGKALSESSVNADEVMAHVGRLACLEVVHLEGRPITDAGLAHLRGHEWLRTIIIRQTKVTGAGVASLSGLPGLLFLDLAGVPLVDADLARLAVLLKSRRAVRPGIPDFLDLNLAQTQITDAGLMHLAGLRPQILLNVEGTAVTEAGVASFLKMQNGTVER